MLPSVTLSQLPTPVNSTSQSCLLPSPKANPPSLGSPQCPVTGLPMSYRGPSSPGDSFQNTISLHPSSESHHSWRKVQTPHEACQACTPAELCGHPPLPSKPRPRCPAQNPFPRHPPPSGLTSTGSSCLCLLSRNFIPQNFSVCDSTSYF